MDRVTDKTAHSISFNLFVPNPTHYIIMVQTDELFPPRQRTPAVWIETETDREIDRETRDRDREYVCVMRLCVCVCVCV